MKINQTNDIGNKVEVVETVAVQLKEALCDLEHKDKMF